MPENNEPTTAPYSAADAYKDVQDAETTEPETTGIEEEEPDDSAASTDEEQADETEVAPADDEDDLPTLDSKILEALGDNTELQDLWKRQWKGITKRETKVKAQEERLGVLETYINAFGDPEHAGPALRTLAEGVAKQLGKPVDELLGRTAPTPAAEAVEFEFDSEKALYERIKRENAETLQQALKQAGVDPALLAELKNQTEQNRAQAARTSLLEGNEARLAVKALARSEDGWKVDQKMIAKALDEFPDLFAKDPAKAIKAANVDALKKHYAGASSSQFKKQVRDMTDGSAVRGNPVKPWNEYTAADAQRDLRDS